MPGSSKISVEIVAAIEGYKRGLTDAGSATRAFASEVQSAFSSKVNQLLAVGGIGFSTDKIVEFIGSMAELGEKTQATMNTLGLTAGQVGVLNGIAKLTGTTTEDLTRGIEHISESVQKANKQGFTAEGEALKVIGLRAKDLIGLPLDQYYLKLADATSKFNPSLNLTNALQTLAGKSINSLIPALMLGSEGFKKYQEDIQATGAVLTNAQAGAFAQTHEKITLLSLSLQGLGVRIFDVVKPAVDGLVTWLTNLVQKMDATTIRQYALALTDTLGNAILQLTGLFFSFGLTLDQVITKLERIAEGALVGAVGGALIGGFGGAILGGAAGGAFANAVDNFLKGGQKAAETVDDQKTKIVAKIQEMQRAVKSALLPQFSVADVAEALGGKMPATGKQDASAMAQDSGADKTAKLKAEYDRLAAEGSIKAAIQQSQFEVELGHKTQAQMLADKITFQAQLDKIDIDAANKKIAAAGSDLEAKQRAENEKLKVVQNAATQEAAIRHQLILEQQKDYLQLANSINSALTQGFASAFDNVTKGIDGLKSALTSFLNSLKSAFSQFAAQQVVKSLFGASSGPGGAGGLIAQLLGGFSGGHASGGTIGAGQWGIVGERGPEVAFGGASGATVFPNGSMGGGTTHNWNIDARGSSMTPQQVMSAVKAGVAQANAMAPQMFQNWQNRMA